MADQPLTTVEGAVIPAEALARLIAQLEQPSPLRGNHIEQVQAHESGRQLGRKQAADSLRALLKEYDALPETEDQHEQ